MTSVLTKEQADELFDLLEDNIGEHEFVLLVHDKSKRAIDYVTNVPPVEMSGLMGMLLTTLAKTRKQ